MKSKLFLLCIITSLVSQLIWADAPTVTYVLSTHAQWKTSEPALEDRQGASITLPKAVGTTGYRVLGWSTQSGGTSISDVDAGKCGAVYAPAGDETLYAVEEVIATQNVFELADSSSPAIAANDKLLCVMEDGGGHGDAYILYSTETSKRSNNNYAYSTRMEEFNKANLNNYSGKYIFTPTVGLDASGYMRDWKGNYFYVNHSQGLSLSGSAMNYSTFKISQLDNSGHYNMWGYINNRFVPIYYDPSKGANSGPQENEKTFVNQWASPQKTLSEITEVSNNYPRAWTIYHQVAKNLYKVTFTPGEGTGEDVDFTGYTITLNDVSTPFTAPTGKVLIGWKDVDSETTYDINASFALTGDLELVAQYGDPKVFFSLGENGQGTVAAMSGPSVVLPSATPKTNFRFLGWSEQDDATQPDYVAGSTYPTSGNLSNSVVLYAVFEIIEQATYYELVTSRSEFATLSSQNAKFIFSMQDGIPNGVSKAMVITNGYAYLKAWDPNETTGSEFYVYARTADYPSNAYYLEVSNTIQLFQNSSTDVKGYNYNYYDYATWKLVDITPSEGRYAITGAYNNTSNYLCDYGSYYNSNSDKRNLYLYGSSYCSNQYDPAQTMAAIISNSKYPYIWTIYKVCTGPKIMASFVCPGTSANVPSQYGPKITMPTAIEVLAPVNKALDYWEDDAQNHYNPGQTYLFNSADVVLTAVYRDCQVNYFVQNATCAETSHAMPSATLPSVTPNSGYRFLGWSTQGFDGIVDAGTAGTVFEFSQETNLYAVCLPTSVWVKADQYSDVASSQCLLTVCGAKRSVDECYAVNYNNAKGLDLVPYMKHGVIVDPPATAILNTEHEAKYYYLVGNTKYYVYTNPGNWGTQTPQVYSYGSPRLTTSWNSTYKTMTFTYTYSNTSNDWKLGSGASWGAGSGTNQYQYKQSLSELWSLSNAATAFALWKRQSVAFINFDLQGGTSSDTGIGYGVIDRLPWAEKDGYRLYGWQDEGGAIYMPGDRYPESGYITDEDVTLTAIFRAAEFEWTPVTSVSDLTVGDSVLFVIADGDDSGNSYALHFNSSLTHSTTQDLELLDWDNVNKECLLGVAAITPASNIVQLVDANDYYLDYGSTNYFNAGSRTYYPNWVITDLSENNHIAVRNSYNANYFWAYSTPTTCILSNQKVNQHTVNTSLANTYANQSKYAYAWTLYKRDVVYQSTLTFDAGLYGTYDGGNIVAPSTTPINLPNLTSLHSDYVFLGWFDGSDTIALTDDYLPSNDITLHAVYERKQAYFDLQGHGTWSDHSSDNKTIVGVVEDETHYVGVDAVGAVTAENGYRFLGWSTDKNASEPMYTGSQKVNVETPVILYAVYSADFVFRLVTSVDEIADGDSVIIAVQGGDVSNPQAYCVVNGTSYDITDYVQRDILVVKDYSTYYVKAIKSNATYAFCQYSQQNVRDCYLDYSVNTNYPPYESYATYSYIARYWTLTWLPASKRIRMTSTYTLAYKNGKFFVGGTGVDQVVNRTALNTGSGTTSFHDNDGASALSIFKRYPLHTLTYNANGGVCDVTSEFGGSEALPEATKAGTDFLGWKDANGVLHYAGERYPATGAIADDETLTAEFRDAKREYEQITSTSQIHNGDVLLITIEDGDGGSTRYVIENTGNNVTLDDSQSFDLANTTKAHRFVATTTSTENLFTFYNMASKNYIYVTAAHYTTPPVMLTSVLTDVDQQNPQKAIYLVSDDNGHFYLRSNVSSGGYGIGRLIYQPSETIHLSKNSANSYCNQYTLNKSLENGVSTGKYPEAWTIYRETTTFTPAITFDAGTQGVCDKDTMMGFSVILPPVHDVAEGLSFGGWSDGVTTYPAGATYTLTVDITLHATYETTRAHFIVDPTYGQPVAEQIGNTIEIPICTPNTGYRFLGWSNNNVATVADPSIVVGSTVSLSQSEYYYAIFESLQTCGTFTRINYSQLANNDTCLLVFEDGDGAPNKYMINIPYGFQLIPLNQVQPQESAVMIYTSAGGGGFRNSSNYGLGYSTSNNVPYLNTSGTALRINELSNGGIYLYYYYAYNSLAYSLTPRYKSNENSPTELEFSTSGVVDQWAQNKSLAQVKTDGNHPRNIALYRKVTKYAYYVHYTLYPSSANIASEEVCATYLPIASDFPAPYQEHFIGWATSPENADARVVAYQPGAYFSPTQDVTLYAVYDHMGKVRDGDNYYETFDAAIGDNKSNLILVEDIASNLVVNDGKNITLDANGKMINGSITVKQGGVLNLTATTAANACYIEATSGKSGQIKNADLINSSNIYVDIQLESTKSKADGRKWYGFAVPFNVDPTSGITNLEKAPTILTSGVDFYIAKYSGTQRAATRDGWQYPSTDMLVPGQFYMITIDGSCNVWRFKKANGATKFASSELALSAYPSALGIGEANWNAMGNPCLEYSNISSASTEYGYIYNNATSAYTAYRLADYSFVVGCPIFLQAEGGTMVLNHTGILSQLFAPERSAEARDGFKVMLSNASTTDNLYVTAAADAMPTYQTGKDVVKLGNALPMLWTEAYGLKLAAENAVLMDDRAEYDLHFYAPSAGIFTLSAERFMGDKQLDLYYAGQLVCTLSEAPYTLDLQRGFNAGYRLVIHTPMGVSTDWHQATESFDSANKYIQDNQLYIRINGLIYNAIGAIVK